MSPTWTSRVCRSGCCARPLPRLSFATVLRALPNSEQRVKRASAEHQDKQPDSGHTVTFITRSGFKSIKASKGANIYNSADFAGINLPAVCKQGSCSSCAGKVVSGTVKYIREPLCLTPKLKAEGYVALCVATVVGDVSIQTHMGAQLRAQRAEEGDRMRHPH